jgi:SAM-dependent methyltransferase
MVAASHVPPVPAVLRLVQSVVLGRWRTSVDALYREIASLLDAGPGKELLVCGCGDGRSAEWLAQRTGAQVVGVDPDPARIEAAESRARAAGLQLPVSFQQSALDDLPHEDSVFDGVVAEPVLAAAASPERAIRELVRVAKPMAPVVLCELAWNVEFDADARVRVIERLGLRPYHIVEWKRMMRDAGLVELTVQDWTDSPGVRGPTPTPTFTWPQKMQIVGRVWRRWGWREARGAVEKETALLRELSRERAIGFQVISGVKWPHRRES